MLKARYLSPLIVAAGIAALPAWSQAVIAAPAAAPEIIVVEVAPPPARQEAIPPAREGYVWAPGYWNYDGSRHVLVEGHHVPSQAGMVYVAPTWEERSGRYALRGERWEKDPVKPNPLGNSPVNPLRPSPGQ
jgi:hypothetical protein